MGDLGGECSRGQLVRAVLVHLTLQPWPQESKCLESLLGHPSAIMSIRILDVVQVESEGLRILKKNTCVD